MRKLFHIGMLLLVLTACGGEQEKKSEKKSQLVNEKAESKGEQEISMNGNEQKLPAYRMNLKNFTFEPIAGASSKVVLLTIDDAPDQYALDMARTLKQLHVPAIFFVNGHFIQTPEKEAILKEIYELGFTIGNHTYGHRNLTSLTAEEQYHEIISVNDLVEEITGERPKFFRAPFGANTEESKQIVADEKMLWMNWTYGYDWEEDYMTPEAISDIMVETEFLQDGANLLMHDRKWTSAGLEQIVEGLRAKGYEILDPQLIDIETES